MISLKKKPTGELPDAKKPLIDLQAGSLILYGWSLGLGIGLAWLIPLVGRWFVASYLPHVQTAYHTSHIVVHLALLMKTILLFLGFLGVSSLIILSFDNLIVLPEWRKGHSSSLRAAICVFLLVLPTALRLLHGLEHPVYAGVMISVFALLPLRSLTEKPHEKSSEEMADRNKLRRAVLPMDDLLDAKRPLIGWLVGMLIVFVVSLSLGVGLAWLMPLLERMLWTADLAALVAVLALMAVFPGVVFIVVVASKLTRRFVSRCYPGNPGAAISGILLVLPTVVRFAQESENPVTTGLVVLLGFAVFLALNLLDAWDEYEEEPVRQPDIVQPGEAHNGQWY